jgi:hypothetical protein
MAKEPVSPKDIYEAALQVFLPGELSKMPRQQSISIALMIERRLNQDGPPPTKAELEGIKELVLEHLWHPALSALSEILPSSPTPKQET